MKRLKQSLQSVLPDPTSLGGDNSGVDRERLGRVLTALVADLGRTLLLRSLISLVLIAALAFISWRVLTDPPQLIATALGISIIALAAVVSLREVSDELARARMFQAISPDLSREALTEVTRWLATAG